MTVYYKLKLSRILNKLLKFIFYEHLDFIELLLVAGRFTKQFFIPPSSVKVLAAHARRSTGIRFVPWSLLIKLTLVEQYGYGCDFSGFWAPHHQRDLAPGDDRFDLSGGGFVDKKDLLN